MNPELGRQFNSKLVLLVTLLTLLTSCMPSKANIGENGVVGYYGETEESFEPSTASPLIWMSNMDGVHLDPQILGGFLSSMPTVNGCVMPTPENPIYLAGDFDGARTESSDVLAYLIGDGKVIYLAKGRPITLHDLIHEFHHAQCQALTPDSTMSGWSPTQRNFKISDDRIASLDTDVNVIEQQGFSIKVQVGDDKESIDALEEMAASMFLLNELNSAEPGYGTNPGKYMDLFQLTHDYLVFYGAESVTRQEMYDTLRVAFDEGRGKSDGYTIVFNHLENLLRTKGVEIREDFRTGIIQYYYSWEKTSDSVSQTEGGAEIIASTLKNR